jgi:hypothetical protein
VKNVAFDVFFEVKAETSISMAKYTARIPKTKVGLITN